jgi:putative ABC transport system substrate-binding protein
MRRREFITVLGVAATWPFAARAQQPVMPVIGFLGSESPDLYADRLRAFSACAAGEACFGDGRNVAIEYRWAESQYDRLPALAADLVRRQVTVVVATTTPATLSAKAATTTIPIIFLTGTDPVEVGIVTSLSRPGGNMTGVAKLTVETAAKQLELLHELVPAATVIAVLVNPANPIYAETLTKNFQAAARAIGQQIRVVSAGTESDIDTAFAGLAQQGVGALVVANDAFFNSRPNQLAVAAAAVAAARQERLLCCDRSQPVLARSGQSGMSAVRSLTGVDRT